MKLLETFWHKKQAAAPALNESSSDSSLIERIGENEKEKTPGGEISLLGLEQKEFNWAHYSQTIGGASELQSEFNIALSASTMKRAYKLEHWIFVTANAIGRQFMQSRFLIETVTNGGKSYELASPLLSLLAFPGSEPAVSFHSSCITELIVTGSQFIWIGTTGKSLYRLPTDRMSFEVDANGQIVKYKLQKASGGYREFDPAEIIAIKMPNIFSRYVGLSLYMTCIMPVLIDKYGLEFVVGFFLRGGSTAGIMESDTNQPNTLVRLMQTLMQAFGSRRNMHSDKVLPSGLKWVAQGQKFSEIQLKELMNMNAHRFMSATGVPPAELGETDGLNFSNAQAQMGNFWQKTILPLQLIYASGIMASPLWERFGYAKNQFLVFDNSGVPFLDKTVKMIEDDTKMKEILTINERRARLGYPPLAAGDPRGNLLSVEVQGTANRGETSPTPPPAPTAPSAPPAADGTALSASRRLAHEKAADAAETRMRDLFLELGKSMAEALLSNEGADAARAALRALGEGWGQKFASEVLPALDAVYREHIEDVAPAKSAKGIKAPDEAQAVILEELRVRAMAYLSGQIASKAQTSFYGFSDTLTARAYEHIERMTAEGKTPDEIQAYLRERFFPEFFEGQLNTIARTEVHSAVGQAARKFGEDLATVTKKMGKKWLSRIDNHTRDSHRKLDNKELVGSSDPGAADYVMALTFDGDHGKIRYPHDPEADPHECINCRCVLSYTVHEWKKENV